MGEWSEAEAEKQFVERALRLAASNNAADPSPRPASNGEKSTPPVEDDTEGSEGDPKMLLQPETRPISHEQLVIEVKGIYAGLVMVEAKSIDIDERQSAAAQEKDPVKRVQLKNDQWQSLIALHKQLLHEHHDFFLASQHPSASLALQELAAKYSMPGRMWRHGIHAFLEVLRHRLPESLEHMLAFIYIAYTMVALLYETVPTFEDTWIECLGDLGRYRMAIEDDEAELRETWSNVARFWYSIAADKHPTVGRLYHHLAILARPYSLEQLSLYTRSLTCIAHFESARVSIMTLFNPSLRGKPPSSFEPALIELHAILFTSQSSNSFARFDDALEKLENGGLLKKYISRAPSRLKEKLVHAAVSNIAALFEYGTPQENSSLCLAYQQAQTVKEEPTEGSVDDSEILPSSTGSPKSEVDDTGSSEPGASVAFISYASRLASAILAISLERAQNENVHPSLNVYLTFIWSLIIVQQAWSPVEEEKVWKIIENDIPWLAICSFLNTLLAKLKAMAEDSPKLVEAMTVRVWAENFPETGRPLQEDFIMRGQRYTGNYFPDTWFQDAVNDDDEPMVQARWQRLLWLGIRIASAKRWIRYDMEKNTKHKRIANETRTAELVYDGETWSQLLKSLADDEACTGNHAFLFQASEANPPGDSEIDSSSQSSSPGDSVSSSGSSAEGEGDEKLQKILGALKKETGKLQNKREVELNGTNADFIRLDHLWSNDKHRYVLEKSSEHTEAGKYEQYAFNVRRSFDWENKHTGTSLDIRSKPLKAALRHIMGQVKGISLEGDLPSVDPKTIFLFLEELRAYMKTLRAQSKAEKKQEKAKEIALKAKHLKVLIKYLDHDYDETKKSLYPLLESKKITFDLLWALYKSNEIVFAPTYNTEDEPRAFKLEYTSLDQSIVKGNYYTIEGRYLEFDGKIFGKGKVQVTVEAFKGPRPISSLNCFPLRFHPDPAKLEKKLIERGKKFTDLAGEKNRVHEGIAFYKKRLDIVKVNIAGRVMIDPATFRRINPNYPISTIKPEDKDILSEPESDDSDEPKDNSSDGEDQDQTDQFDDGKKEPKPRMKWVKDKETNKFHCVDVPVNEAGNVVQAEEIEEIPRQNNSGQREFTDEEYLIASPVALGFSFDVKLWLELAVDGIREIDWNENAFDSLVIPQAQKKVVQSLKASKGTGLVAVLHGPPGTGKTLTAEAIAEMLKKPLYSVSAGELGTSMTRLEKNLSEILDIAHTWRAILLIDEADVFLEQRDVRDVGRNALVSIFLRKLEYFQGILFLTTNRVATFDEAFQSRIHIGLRYGKLDIKAKKGIWKCFIDRVRALPDVEVADFTEDDFTKLSNFEVNGREIKNAIRTAQSIALNEDEKLSMMHLLSVLLVADVFANDLKGPGYAEALKCYM
ncbi:hypothetical protein OEA41_008695 [Lepraria neglecta]|uniref:AAA+ ATPase domain-containing protein n=1 Tax=Lepraria neglecta TaxID=209136 RepID=A0AAD9Z3J6_9LECA|nr:hypothetical protein OEA41_008695 [Lepraria neglecta]